MDKAWLIVAIVFFVMAAALVVLNLVLPADNLMFMVGEVNRPWLAPVFAAVGGLVFLAMAMAGGRASAQATGAAGAGSAGTDARPTVVIDPERAALNKRLEGIALAIFLVMLGVYWILPRTNVSAGIWALVAGLIMLGLNYARYRNHLRMSGFTTFLGIVSVTGGILQLAGLKGIEDAFFLIILGAFLLLKPLFDRRQVFGKAEQA